MPIPSTRFRLVGLAGLAAALATGTLQAAVETWTNTDNLTMRAEFIARKGAYVSFRREDGTRYIYAYAQLRNEDRARIDQLTGTGLAEPEPEPAAAVSAPVVPASPPPPPAPAAVPGKVGTLIAGLATKLVEVNGKALHPVTSAQLRGIRYVAVYYSAHWCPPCRGFTPELVAAYAAIKPRHPEFEVIFVSSDEDEASMINYMVETGMKWPTLRFDKIKSEPLINRPSYERGIPNLVFLDADGKRLATSYTPDGDYSGPREVLKVINAKFK